MIMSDHPLPPSSGISSSSGYRKYVYIYDIPLSIRQQLCDHLDELKVWEEFAKVIKLREDEIRSIRRQLAMGNSPTDEILKIWGGQYNHNATELFCALYRLQLHHAMRMLKDFVEQKYHMLIPNSPPVPDNVLDDAQSNNTSCELSGSLLVLDYLKKGKLNKRYASSSLEINYHDLTVATNNWSKNHILGKGGYGTVYRGNWKHTDVAIKQLHSVTPDGSEAIKVQLAQSFNELKYLSTCRHDNVLPLYGYSLKGEKPCLVYQLMTGGTLEEHLHKNKYSPLTLQQRINICLGTARGINYLHTFCDTPLIHGDIKPANVLLDRHFKPKIGDFGLAREGPNSVTSDMEVKQIFGTKPYLPPDFLESKKLSTLVDTYSFGVVLLETFTGLPGYTKNWFLTSHIKILRKGVDGNLGRLIDQKIPFLLPAEEEACISILTLGLKCIAKSSQSRPDMETVLKEIERNSNLIIFS